MVNFHFALLTGPRSSHRIAHLSHLVL